MGQPRSQEANNSARSSQVGSDMEENNAWYTLILFTGVNGHLMKAGGIHFSQRAEELSDSAVMCAVCVGPSWRG